MRAPQLPSPPLFRHPWSSCWLIATDLTLMSSCDQATMPMSTLWHIVTYLVARWDDVYWIFALPEPMTKRHPWAFLSKVTATVTWKNCPKDSSKILSQTVTHDNRNHFLIQPVVYIAPVDLTATERWKWVSLVKITWLMKSRYSSRRSSISSSNAVQRQSPRWKVLATSVLHCT